jgi:uncharacterized membrane protein
MMSPSDQGSPLKVFSRGIPGNERIIALSDGVFAIVITLLVLELRVPDVAKSELSDALVEIAPKILSHAISFVVLGIYWIGHHNMFMHVKRHDRVLLWLNILFLLFVASMPFPTGLIVQYFDQQLAIVLYAGLLVAAGLSLDLIWWYVTRSRRLVEEDMTDSFVTYTHRRILAAPLLYLIAIVLSFFSVALAYVTIIAAIAYYIVPLPFDRFHHIHIWGSTEDSE